MEELQKTLTLKLNLLAVTKGETTRVTKRRKTKELQNQINNIETTIDEVRSTKRKMQELKLAQNQSVEEVRAWSDGIEDNLEEYLVIMEDLESVIQDIKKKQINETLQEQEKMDSINLQKRMEEEKQIELMKIQIRNTEEKKSQEQSTNNEKVNVKLPKLIITPFNGTFLDWLRFWGQFEIEIDKSQLSPVGKFSYLKELVTPKVRVLIDNLPFNTEGYERAKTILKNKYGRPTEVANAHVQAIMNLPIISQFNLQRIHDFYETLVKHIHALESMKKLSDIKGYVRNTLDKLPAIRSDILRTEDDWQDWGYKELIAALQKWVDRNPIPDRDKSTHEHRRDRFLHANQRERQQKPCVYCGKTNHRAADCKSVTSIDERKSILSKKQLCFNCTGSNHQAEECKSNRTCRNCNKYHHTSICNQNKSSMLTTIEADVIYPTIVVEVNNIKCRALLDTGAGNSYASSALLKRINAKPKGHVVKQIEMMMTTLTQKLEVYDITIQSANRDFELTTEVSKVERENLVQVPNPKYHNILKSYDHLKDVTIADNDPKPELPIHIVLGISDYTKVKQSEAPRIGKQGEPVAELTKFGWVLTSPGKESDITKSFLATTSIVDFNKLCDLDVLGVTSNESTEDLVYDEFKSQLEWNPEGFYETNLIWKRDHPSLSDNKAASIARLKNLQRKLSKNPKLFNDYDAIIQDQIEKGVVEEVNEDHQPANNRTFFLPHHAVIRDDAETTKLRIVYDASAKPTSSDPSLNECLESGPCFQKLLWDILVRIRFQPIVLCGDLQKAFWQIRIREAERDSLRFHWFKDRDPNQIQVYRFTRVLFGLVQSPFLLEATLRLHFQKYADQYPEIICKLQEDTYVDDLVSGDHCDSKVQSLKDTARNVFKEAGFTLHKWHSNKSKFEESEAANVSYQTYAKEQLGVKPAETKILGISWNKRKDTFSIDIPAKTETLTKRTILRKLAQIYDPLGFISPVTLVGKTIFRRLAENKLPWDKQLPPELAKEWRDWEAKLPISVTLPRSINLAEEELTVIDIHVFGDASLTGTCAVAYATIQQPSSIKQGLIASKSRLSKKGQTIPRLELIAAQMSVNLAENIEKSLSSFNVRHIHAWSDSTVVLYWIRGNSTYKQFVQNRVEHIKQKSNITWRHVPTQQNPADIGSRGSTAAQLGDKWFVGPPWLSQPENYPQDIIPAPSKESERETKNIKTVFCATTKITNNDFDALVEKHNWWKFIRVTGWIYRFIGNCKKGIKVKGPLTTTELERQENHWIKREQQKIEESTEFQMVKQQLNLQKNANDIYVCMGRIQGDYPIYIPTSSILSAKLIEQSHKLSMHGGVPLTISTLRNTYWIPKVRTKVKQVIKNCNRCKRFSATALPVPPKGLLPADRTQGDYPFQIVGTDFAGPIYYANKQKTRSKAYIIIFACSLSRAIHIEVVPNQSTKEFVHALKRFTTRRGFPTVMYSDNAKTFIKASKWIKTLNNETTHQFLSVNKMHWKFNLSRSPWWGGQHERLIGLTKNSLYKTIGRALLKWSELQEVLLDVENVLNNRPLCYIDDDIQYPALTPNRLLLGRNVPIITYTVETQEDMKKRFKYIEKCKRDLWNRWKTEYVKALRERHNLTYRDRKKQVQVGDVVIIKGPEKNRSHWKVGVVSKVFPGRDNVIRAVQLKVGTQHLERPVQHLFPLELTCDAVKNVDDRDNTIQIDNTSSPLNADAIEFRPKRNAAVIAKLLNEQIISDELDI